MAFEMAKCTSAFKRATCSASSGFRRRILYPSGHPKVLACGVGSALLCSCCGTAEAEGTLKLARFLSCVLLLYVWVLCVLLSHKPTLGVKQGLQ